MTFLIDRSDLDKLTARLLLLALILAFLHHVDHALRVDHSGWPFKDQITPFTYSLGAYPVILFALLGPRRLFWLRWVFLAAATLFTLYAHTVVESPYAQFHMWAENSSVHTAGVRNAFGVESRAMGLVSVCVAMTLNIVAVVSTFAMLRTGMRSNRASS